MDLNNLKNNKDMLISHMKKNGYSYGYISKINARINDILNNANECKSYLDYYNCIIKPYLKENTRER